MDLKNLKKSTVILNEIEQLDKDIISIDALAIAIVKGEITTSFSINGEKKKTMSAHLNKDGDLIIENEDCMKFDNPHISGASIFSFFQPRMRMQEKQSNPDYQLQFDLTEETTLQLLGVLLGDKQRRRESLIVQLKNLGFNL